MERPPRVGNTTDVYPASQIRQLAHRRKHDPLNVCFFEPQVRIRTAPHSARVDKQKDVRLFPNSVPPDGGKFRLYCLDVAAWSLLEIWRPDGINAQRASGGLSSADVAFPLVERQDQEGALQIMSREDDHAVILSRM